MDGSWGSLCDDNFTMVEANLVCKHAGFHLGAKEVRIDRWLICFTCCQGDKGSGKGEKKPNWEPSMRRLGEMSG